LHFFSVIACICSFIVMFYVQVNYNARVRLTRASYLPSRVTSLGQWPG
jgi:hypothetical protein